MKATLLPLALLAAFVVPGCAAPKNTSSEVEWSRGQCAQVIDKEAREKCMERVERESRGK